MLVCRQPVTRPHSISLPSGARIPKLMLSGRLIAGRLLSPDCIRVSSGSATGNVYVRLQEVARKEDESGFQAPVVHTGFESGRYRCYCGIEGLDSPVFGHEAYPPPRHATIDIDSRHAFVFD